MEINNASQFISFITSYYLLAMKTGFKKTHYSRRIKTEYLANTLYMAFYEYNDLKLACITVEMKRCGVLTLFYKNKSKGFVLIDHSSDIFQRTGFCDVKNFIENENSGIINKIEKYFKVYANSYEESHV